MKFNYAVNEIAEKQGYSGLKKVLFYIISPFVWAAGFIIGYIKTWIKPK